MVLMKSRRARQVLQYGWIDAGAIRKNPEVRKSRMSIFIDIWRCYRRYYIFSKQYSDNLLWKLEGEDKIKLAQTIGETNKIKDHWIEVYYDNWKFLNKYTSFKWQETPELFSKRNEAYKKQFGLGEGLTVQYGVTLICEHFSIGKITCGKNVLLARNCDIDYTGDIEIGDNVGILEGAKILTHAHDSYHFMKDSELIPFSNRAYKTNLKIGDNVSICAHAVILPGVGEIGENSIISAGAIVNRPVPANVIVAGNPAQIVRKIPAVVKRTKH